MDENKDYEEQSQSEEIEDSGDWVTLDDMTKAIEETPPPQTEGLSDELPGDENYPHYLMPDGTMNFKYIESLPVVNLDEEEAVRLHFSDFPGSIKVDIIRKLIIGIIVLAAIIPAVIYFKVQVVASIFFICIPLAMILSAIIRYMLCRFDSVVKFQGIIISVDTIGIMKATRYQVVKISNDEKFLNIKVPFSKDLDVGLPITVYINKDEPIIKSQYGPLAENYIAYTLSAESEEEEEKLSSDGGISAEDYV